MRGLPVLLAATLAPCLAAAAGVTGRGGLEAVALSPDGKTVACGGQNRVVYLVDTGTLTVRSRIWVGTRIGGLAFNRDGTRLVVEDEIDQCHLFEVTTSRSLAQLPRVAGMVARPGSNLAVVRDLDEPNKNVLRFLSLDRLEEIGRADLPERPTAWTLDAAGKQAFVLSLSQRSDEPRIPNSEVPRELKGLERWTFRQKNDGMDAAIVTVEVPSGKVLGTTRTWYTSDSDSTRIARQGDVTFVFNRYNICARIEGKGGTKLFETPQGVNQALGTSANGKVLVTGGMGGGFHGPVEGGKMVPFRVEPLRGQAEFFTRFSVHDDGTAWGVTTAYRLVSIGGDGALRRVVPVY